MVGLPETEMKAKTLSLLVGTAVPLILTGSATAGFLGIETVSKPNDFGIFTVNVYAVFDRPGEDLMIAVAGTPFNPLDISVVDGTFFQHAAGTDRAPLGTLIDVFPDLAYDTFVTIGVKQVGPGGGNPGQPFDNLTLTPGWPGFGLSNLQGTNMGWAVRPDAPQADPFNRDFYPGDGRVLIGQFSTQDGIGITGTMLTKYIDNGIADFSLETFEHFIPAPGTLILLAFAPLFRSRRSRD